MEKYKIILFSSLIVIGVSSFLLFAVKNNQLSGTDNQQVKQEQIEPKLSAIEYTAESISNDKVEIHSQNYAFKIAVPKNYDFSSGGGFNEYFPKNQTVDVGASDKNNHDGITLSVGIGFLNDKNIEMIVDEHIKATKQNVYPKSNPNDIKDDAIKLNREDTVINGESTIRINYVGTFDEETISYYFHRNDKYYRVYFGRNDSGHFTNNQLQEINEVINSFKFI